MPGTYEPIVTQSVSGTTVSITSIPSTYTDLVLIFSGTTAGGLIGIQYNGDTGSNYSSTLISGAYGNTYGLRYSTAWTYVFPGGASTIQALIININNYSNTTTYKTSLSKSSYTDESVTGGVQLWRSTSAINRVDLFTSGAGTFSGTVTLYGIKAA